MSLPEQPWFILCPPCQASRHEDCQPVPLCECLTEVLIEAEEAE